MFSSPHLISPRERIRINGKPLSEKAFTKYFFEVFNYLKQVCKFFYEKFFYSYLTEK